VDCFKVSNGQTPLPDWPDTFPGQVTRQNESDGCTRGCLITIQAHEPSAEPCKEGVHCLKIVELLRNAGVCCRIGQALARAELRIKMSQSSVLEHAWLQFELANPVLNLARNKQWTASKFEMDGLLCLMGRHLPNASYTSK
jgi:hypothetical protein